MSRLVIDASMAVGLVHESQSNSDSEAVGALLEAGGELVVPALWFPEIANVVLVLGLS